MKKTVNCESDSSIVSRFVKVALMTLESCDDWVRGYKYILKATP